MVIALGYSKEIADEILKKFNQKGWSLYHKRDIEKIGRDGVIRNNLAEHLDMEVSYVLLPAADNPKDPKQVMNALEKLAQKLGKEMPTIKIGFEKYPLTGITLKADCVKVHTPEGAYLNYGDFIDSLGSIAQTY